MADLYYIEEGYYDTGYFVYTADAASALSTTATVSCSCGVIKSAEVECGALFSPSIDAKVNKSTDIDLSATVTMSISVNKTVDSSATLDNIINLSAQGDRLRFVDSALSSEFTAAVEATKVLSATAALSSTVSLSALGGLLVQGVIGYLGDRTAKTVTEYGNVAISTAQSKFGSSSMLITDTGDYITVSPDSSWIEYQEAFTVEFWIYASNLTTIPNAVLWTNQTSSSSGYNLYISYGSIGLYEGVISKGLSTAGFVNNSWNHIALVREASPIQTLKVFVNGTRKVNSSSYSNYSNRTTYIGSSYLGTSPFRGYIDEVRYSYNARYTTAGTAIIVPTASFVNDSDTALLLHFEGSFADDINFVQGPAIETSLSATSDNIYNVPADLSTASFLSIDFDRIRSATADLSVEGFELIEGRSLRRSSAALTATATMTVSVNYITQAESTLTAATTATADAVVIYDNSAALSLNASISATPSRIIDVFVSGKIGQVYFNNTSTVDPSYSTYEGYKFIQASPQINTGYNTRTEFALGFWSSGYGYIWSSVNDDSGSNYDNWIKLTEDGDFEFYFFKSTLSPSSVSLTWSGIDTGVNNHYLLYCDGTGTNKLYVNGVDQGSPTVSGSALPRVYYAQQRTLALRAERWGYAGSNLVGSAQGFQGAVGQYVYWHDGLSLTVPDFTQSSERLKIYNNGYVDIGTTGTDTGLIRPYEYLKLSNRYDLIERGSSTEQMFPGDPPWDPYPAIWRQLGTTTVISGYTYRYVNSYSPNEYDDVGPFTGVFLVDAAPIITLIVAADLVATTTLTADVTKLVGIIEDLSSQTTLTADNLRNRYATADLTVAGSELIIAVKTGRIIVDMPSAFTSTAALIGTRRAQADLTAIATMSCQAVKNVQASSTLATTSTLGIDYTRLRYHDSALAVSASSSITAKKITDISTAMSSQFSQLAISGVYWKGQAALASEFTQSTFAVAGKIVTAHLTVAQTMTPVTLNSKIMYLEADLQALDFLLAIGTKITIDPYYQLVVDRELRVKKIAQETGLLVVDPELRLNTIQAENNTIIVPSESSIWHIPYAPQQGARRVK